MGIVGANDKAVALVVDGILVAGAAGRDQEGCDVRGGGRYEANLGGDVVACADKDEFSRRGDGKADEKAGVGLLVDHGILGDGLAEDVATHLPGTPVLVNQSVEERGVVGGPDGVAHGAFDFFFSKFPGDQVLDDHAEAL